MYILYNPTDRQRQMNKDKQTNSCLDLKIQRKSTEMLSKEVGNQLTYMLLINQIRHVQHSYVS